MKIRCIVIDDEPLALNVLATYIRQTDFLQLADVTTDPVQGLERILANEADLVFLDIQMPNLNGIDLLKKAGARCKFILTTAFAEFALEGYELNVTDYLLKPIGYERFLKAVQKLRKPDLDYSKIELPTFIFVKSEYKLLRVDYSNIKYLEGLRDYVVIHTVDGQKILTLQSLSFFEKELPPALFARVHKSFIVALQLIELIEKNTILLGKYIIPIGGAYRKNLMKYVKRQRD